MKLTALQQDHEMAGQTDEAARAGDYAKAAELAETAGCRGAARGYQIRAEDVANGKTPPSRSGVNRRSGTKTRR